MHALFHLAGNIASILMVIINIFQTVKKTGVPFQINPNKIQNKLCE
jgi:hypothetical protein